MGADRFAEAVVAKLGGYDLDTPDGICSVDTQRTEIGATDLAACSNENATDHSRWRDLLDDVAHLSNQVERMLSQQEDAFHDEVAPSAFYETTSQDEIRQDTLW